VTGPRHQRRRRDAGRRRVRDRRVPAVVERPHRLVDLRPRERELERGRVAGRVERPAALRAEHSLVVALVRRPSAVVEQLRREPLAERDRPF
jgi:hypothetical protein